MVGTSQYKPPQCADKGTPAMVPGTRATPLLVARDTDHSSGLVLPLEGELVPNRDHGQGRSHDKDLGTEQFDVQQDKGERGADYDEQQPSECRRSFGYRSEERRPGGGGIHVNLTALSKHDSPANLMPRSDLAGGLPGW